MGGTLVEAVDSTELPTALGANGVVGEGTDCGSGTAEEREEELTAAGATLEVEVGGREQKSASWAEAGGAVECAASSEAEAAETTDGSAVVGEASIAAALLSTGASAAVMTRGGTRDGQYGGSGVEVEAKCWEQVVAGSRSVVGEGAAQQQQQQQSQKQQPQHHTAQPIHAQTREVTSRSNGQTADRQMSLTRRTTKSSVERDR